jgi:hypothetical protein
MVTQKEVLDQIDIDDLLRRPRRLVVLGTGEAIQVRAMASDLNEAQQIASDQGRFTVRPEREQPGVNLDPLRRWGARDVKEWKLI